ncbi:MAG: serine hydrolase [Cyclobacteriaceae bacterium]|nr:MAG: serine hydrolase [Cyclobacteriaceae bacterium]
MRFIVLFLLAGTILAQKKPAATDKKVQELEAYILKGMADWQMPGLAVVVVKDGRVLLARGYGVRQLNEPAAVNPNTLFACASTTKAMTAACMGMLVDEGKVSWDDPVYKHLPEFQLYDPYVTRELRIRDLFTHNSGVGNADFLWGAMNISTEEVLRKMRQVPPSYSLRGGFIYQNIMYVAAGEVIHRVSGKPWHEFMRERLFKPLGMNRTFPFLHEAMADANHAKPHFKIEGKIQVIEHTSADAVGAAGSVWSCADDIAKWVQCMLDSAKYNGGRLLTPKTWMELFKPQVIVPAEQFYPTARLTKPNWTTYGLGWFQHDYKGRKVNFHTGSLAGAIALHAQLPEEKLGLYVFGNQDHAELRHALMYKAFDIFALGGNRDWSLDFKKLYDSIEAVNQKQIADFESKRIPNTQPSLPMPAYAGKYVSPLYGELVVTYEGDELIIELNKFIKARMQHWHYDVFRGWYDKKWYGRQNLIFDFSADGKIKQARLGSMEFVRVK